MGKRICCRPVVLAVLLLGFITLPLGAQEVAGGGDKEESQGFFSKLSWHFDMSVLFFPEDNGLESDPMPVLPSPGFGVSYPIVNIFAVELRLELGFDFYMTHYGFALDRAVPQAIENRSARVIGTLMTIQAMASYDINSLLSLRFFVGPAADLRIVFMAAGLNSWDEEDASSQTDSVRNYFWSKGRWFMPVTGIGTDFTINSRFKLGIDFKVWMPIYRLWSGEDLPSIEGWRFGVGARFTIR